MKLDGSRVLNPKSQTTLNETPLREPVTQAESGAVFPRLPAAALGAPPSDTPKHPKALLQLLRPLYHRARLSIDPL